MATPVSSAQPAWGRSEAKAMKIGLVGYPGSGKSTVFGALTGSAVDTGDA